jgi:hypothetical protein
MEFLCGTLEIIWIHAIVSQGCPLYHHFFWRGNKYWFELAQNLVYWHTFMLLGFWCWWTNWGALITSSFVKTCTLLYTVKNRMMVFHLFSGGWYSYWHGGGCKHWSLHGSPVVCREKYHYHDTKSTWMVKGLLIFFLRLGVALLFDLKKAEILDFLLTYFGITLIFIH